MRYQRIFSLLLLLLLFGVGCNNSQKYTVVPVSGRVTLRGKPVENISVIFQPLAGGTNDKINSGFGSWGLTDSEGRFQLKTVDGKPGAIVGKHKVWLTPYEKPQSTASDLPQQHPQNPLPPNAYNGSLTFEVPPGGTSNAFFDY